MSRTATQKTADQIDLALDRIEGQIDRLFRGSGLSGTDWRAALSGVRTTRTRIRSYMHDDDRKATS